MISKWTFSVGSDWEALDQILKKAKYLDSFCFLRWSEALTNSDALFKKFAHYLSKVRVEKYASV